MPKFKGLKGVLIVLFLAILLVIYFYHLSNKAKAGEEETDNNITVVQETLQRSLSTNYPQTPKEVVKYFSQITQCYYNEEVTDEELEALARQMLLLYDDELVSYKAYEDYIFDLRSDIQFYKQNGYRISNYSPSASTDVFFFTEDGYEWARLYCLYTIKSGKYYKNINEVFVLRKDEKGHWRIFGWKEVNE